MDPKDRKEPIPRDRWLSVGLAVVVAVALIGLFAGTRTAVKPTFSLPRAEGPAEEVTAYPAKSYPELIQRSNRPTASEVLEALQGIGESVPERAPTATSRQQAIRERAGSRAYAGAPPVIPHEVDERDTGACIVCHEFGVSILEAEAPAISHRNLTSCVQCHVVAERSEPGPSPTRVSNAFSGRVTSGNGTRAWVGAPPTIPHPTEMRSNCLGCHGPSGREGLKTPHPQRTSCTQCHVAVAGNL